MERSRKNANVVNREEVEADAKIRAISYIQGAKRERAEDEARVKDDAEIWEKAEKTRKERDAKAKAGDETVER